MLDLLPLSSDSLAWLQLLLETFQEFLIITRNSPVILDTLIISQAPLLSQDVIYRALTLQTSA